MPTRPRRPLAVSSAASRRGAATRRMLETARRFMAPDRTRRTTDTPIPVEPEARGNPAVRRKGE